MDIVVVYFPHGLHACLLCIIKPMSVTPYDASAIHICIIIGIHAASIALNLAELNDG